MYIIIDIYAIYWGRSSVVTASEFKSEDPGFNPLAGQGGEGGGQLFCPSESALSARLVCACDPPSCVWHVPIRVRTLKTPYPSVVK